MRKLAFLFLVLPLAACGGGGTSSSPVLHLTPIAYVKSAAHKTTLAESEHATFTSSVRVAGQAVTLSGAGDFDNTSHQGSMHADFAVSGLSGSIDEVIDGTTIYMRSPLFASSLPAGKTWIKLDLQKALASKGVDFSALLSQDPGQALTRLQSSGHVTKVGDETIDGSATTHYRGTIDPAKLPKGLTTAKYGAYNVWIGKDDGYVHRISFAYTLGKRETIALTMNFSDFGKGVIVTVPPSSEAFDATNAGIKGLGG
jgi:hypothetical protein